MAVVVKTTVQVDITNAPVTVFKSGPVVTTQVALTQTFGADIEIPVGADNQEIYTQHVDRAQHIFLLCDRGIDIKLVVSGQTFSTTPSMRLMPNIPSIICMENIVGIFVSNPNVTGAADARLMVYGAGVDV